MCPKLHKPLGEDQEKQLNSRMATLLSSIYREDTYDSGLDSINLASFHPCEHDTVSSLQNDFLNMKIDSHLQTCHHDSGVYTSVRSCPQRNSETGNIDTLCELRNDDEDLFVINSGKDMKHSPRRKGGIQQLHIRAEQVAMLFEGDKDGDNKLHLSIINGQEAFSILLINLIRKYDWLDFSNHLRQTPLHLAVITRQPKIVRRLICAGATVLAQDKQGDTPLHIACRLGDTEIVNHLLTPVCYEETIHNRYTIPYQRVPQDIRIRNYEGQTCLHVAASAGQHCVVQMLLEAGADINMGDGRSGRTILHMAVDGDDMELVELLLSYSEINVKKQDYAGLTPIQLAYGRNNMNIMKIIYSLSGEYEGVLLSDPEISLDEEDLSDNSFE